MARRGGQVCHMHALAIMHTVPVYTGTALLCSRALGGQPAAGALLRGLLQWLLEHLPVQWLAAEAAATPASAVVGPDWIDGCCSLEQLADLVAAKALEMPLLGRRAFGKNRSSSGQRWRMHECSILKRTCAASMARNLGLLHRGSWMHSPPSRRTHHSASPIAAQSNFTFNSSSKSYARSAPAPAAGCLTD